MITYDPLWNTMKNKGISKYYLTEKCKIPRSTLYRMTKNLPITSETINTLCNILECDVDGVMKHTPDNISSTKIEDD